VFNQLQQSLELWPMLRPAWIRSPNYSTVTPQSIIRNKGRRKTSTTVFTATGQKQSSWQLYNNEKNGLQHIQMESCQTIKWMKD